MSRRFLPSVASKGTSAHEVAPTTDHPIGSIVHTTDDRVGKESGTNSEREQIVLAQMNELDLVGCDRQQLLYFSIHSHSSFATSRRSSIIRKHLLNKSGTPSANFQPYVVELGCCHRLIC
jgi:hypothetical protein